VHHFDLVSISSPQTAGVPFSVTITARDINGTTVTVYNSSMGLSAAGDGGNVPIQPTNTTAFAGGVWSGSVKMLGVGSNVRLTATNNAIGRGVQSNPFEVRGALIVVVPNALTNVPVGVSNSYVRTLTITNPGNQDLTFSITTNCGVSDEGIVVHYTFDQDQGTNVVDSSGNGNNGTMAGSVTYSNSIGDLGLAPRFTSKDTYVISTNTGLNCNGATGLTISVWVKMAAYTTYGRAVTHGRSGAAYLGGGTLSLGGVYGGNPYGGGFSIALSTNESTSLPFPRFASLGTWYHVAALYDGVTLSLYTNGVQYAQTSVPTAYLNRAVFDANQLDFVVGKAAEVPTWTDTHINGWLDDLRIYKRALSVEEVRILARATNAGNSVSWLAIGGSSGTIPAGGSTNVSVVFDATGCVTGQHKETTIIITCNDAVTPSVSVPVSMDVVTPTCRLGLSVSGQGSLNMSGGWFAKGTNLTITATATNYYHFGAWIGTTNGDVVTSNVLALCLDRDRDIIGRFDENLATNQTPEWWLVLNGLTNRAWDVEALDDQDGDGMAAWKEYIAGTCPTNPAECLKIVQVYPSSTNQGNMVFVWQTVTGRNYTVVTATNLFSSWTNVPDLAYTNIPGTALPLCYTNRSMTDSLRYFRVRTIRPQ
jgi:hypothetical protein